MGFMAWGRGNLEASEGEAGNSRQGRLQGANALQCVSEAQLINRSDCYSIREQSSRFRHYRLQLMLVSLPYSS